MKLNRYIVYLMVLVLGILSFTAIWLRADADNEKSVAAICPECNLRNAEGKKVGLWIENNGLTEIYYKDGLPHGIIRNYDPMTQKLHMFGEYKQGNPTGTWYYFGEHGHLALMEKDITKHKIQYDKRVVPIFKSYVVKYYLSGVIKEEGIAQYDESIEKYFVKKGPWKYYAQSGKLTKTVDHD